ncbi:MAG: radical SAM protein [Desulfatitalea sp.]|nr:radical SAM protein [Desulfatitalea sp.]NNK02387.1 radical SAM protein [Desulfatitalea sp.]
MNLDEHPCFNRKSHHQFGRVHLPVAPRCNIQCKFCNRQFDCVNESRPGVTSAVLSPAQAMVYLAQVLRRKPSIRVVGIAGPGDPFANAEQTLDVCRRVRKHYPDMMLCVATNGLNLAPYLDDLAQLKVSHVTVTVNAVDPVIGAEIYAWMRIGKRVKRAEEAAGILLARQMDAIAGLKQRGILVKINSIILPGINDHHIEAVAKAMGALDVDLFNCLPYYPNAGSEFEHLAEPSAEAIQAVRAAAGRHVRQMRHCTRCRSDAVGLLGEPQSEALMATLKNCQHLQVTESAAADVSDRPYVAVASLEGVLVNQHLGEADQLLIYGWRDGGRRDESQRDGRLGLIEARPTPAPGSGDARWQHLARGLADCRALLVSGIGAKPEQALTQSGIQVFTCEGLIDEAVQRVFAGSDLKPMAVRQPKPCGASCGGDMMGCGA